jgi:hypothetical protein
LYLYCIKIQTNIKQNSITKCVGEITNFFENNFLKVFRTKPDQAQKQIWVEAHCSCMNRRRELIHARCSCSEQRGRRRRRRGKEGWLAMAVVWSAWRVAVVADGGRGSGLSSSPLCFAVLFSSSVFRSLCQQGFFSLCSGCVTSLLFAVDHSGGERHGGSCGGFFFFLVCVASVNNVLLSLFYSFSHSLVALLFLWWQLLLTAL